MANETASKPKRESSMIRLSRDIIKPTSKEGRVYASIGLNDEHGKYGTLFFQENMLKNDKNAPNKAYLPLSPDKEYDVVFGNGESRETVKMTGRSIVKQNAAYLKERNAQRTKALESSMEAAGPEMESQAEAGA